MKRSNGNRSLETNRNARIVSRVNGARTVKTKTAGRDDDVLVEARTKLGGNGDTRVFVRNFEGEQLALDGFEARTLYRTLQRHYDETGRSLGI